MPHRDAELDAIRGVIIALVFVASYVTLYQDSVGHAHALAGVPPVGFLALQLFLAVASYRLAADLAQCPSASAYVRARALHYLPPLWPAVALTCAAAALVRLPVRTCPDLASFAANLVMAPDLLGLPVAAPCLWRLKLELLLSVSLGAAWFAFRGRLSACAVLLLLGLQALTSHGADPAHLHVLTLTGALTVDGYLPPCAFGLAIFHLRARPRDVAWRAVAVFSLALLFLIGPPLHEAWSAASFILFAVAAFGRVPLLARLTPLQWLGQKSFAIYVVHQIPGFAVIHTLEKAGVPPLAAVLAASAVVIAAGALLHHAVAAWISRAAGPERSIIIAQNGARGLVKRAAERAGLGSSRARNLRPLQT